MKQLDGAVHVYFHADSWTYLMLYEHAAGGIKSRFTDVDAYLVNKSWVLDLYFSSLEDM